MAIFLGNDKVHCPRETCEVSNMHSASAADLFLRGDQGPEVGLTLS